VATHLVSDATLRNWNKLSVDFSTPKLKSRANKILSDRRIVPLKCISNYKNIATIENIVNYIDKKNLPIKAAINTLCLNMLITAGIVDRNFFTEKKFIKEFIQELSSATDSFLLQEPVPEDEFDFVGSVYQTLLIEGDRNKKGSYYTPKSIIDNILQNVNLQQHQTVLDPCCGSGSFLLNFKTSNPLNIYGFDIDEIAINIAKTNLILQYKHFDFCPNVYKADFLLLNSDLLSDNRFSDIKFDYIVTNPPWGTKHNGAYENHFLNISSREISSYFIVKSYDFLKAGGTMKFVLPESILNIKVHQDIRSFILTKFAIEKISLHSNCFTGVVSNVISLSLKKDSRKQDLLIEDGRKSYSISYNNFNNQENIFNLSNMQEMNLLQKIYKTPYLTLNDSIWGLGIVTGNNKGKLFCKKIDDSFLPIITGKEVKEYVLNSAEFYFQYDRQKLQQVANDNIYKSKEKLVYKFISNKLIFAYDDRQQYVLNSANILIPRIKGIGIKTVLAFLNSDLMQFIYLKTFNQIKVIKSNLCKLPFPIIDEKTNHHIERLVNEIFNGKKNKQKINDTIFEIFNLTANEIDLVRRSI